MKAEDLTSYRERGYMVLRNIFDSDEVEQWRLECIRLLSLPVANTPGARMSVPGSDRQATDRIDPVTDLSPIFDLLSKDERIMHPLGLLIDEDVSLTKDKVIFKPPGMRGYLLHQDFAYLQWLPVSAHKVVIAMIAIDGADAGNGAIEFFPGLHDRLLTPQGKGADVDERDVDLQSGEVLETRPGDLLLFHSLAPHRSGPNLSESSRRQLYFTYAAARYGDLYSHYYKHQVR